MPSIISMIVILGFAAVLLLLLLALVGYVVSCIEMDLPRRGLDPVPYFFAKLFRVEDAFRFDRAAAEERVDEMRMRERRI